MDQEDSLSGAATDRITHAAVLVYELPVTDAPSAMLRAFLGTLDAAGHTLNPHGHGRTQCQLWLTHFAVLLKFENCGRLWVFERDTTGVALYPLDQGLSSSFKWGWREQIRYSESCPVAKACNIAYFENDFPNERSYGRSAQRQDVWNRLRDERSMDYSGIGKNCQHFAYDFYKWTLEHAWIAPMEFWRFGKMLQEEYARED